MPLVAESQQTALLEKQMAIGIQIREEVQREKRGWAELTICWQVDVGVDCQEVVAFTLGAVLAGEGDGGDGDLVGLLLLVLVRVAVEHVSE